MAMPIVVQTGFQLKPLPRKALVERGRSQDCVCLPIRRVGRAPDYLSCAVSHHNGTFEMIGMNLADCSRFRTGICNHCQRSLVKPDTLPSQRAVAVIFRDDVAAEVVNIVKWGGARKYKRLISVRCTVQQPTLRFPPLTGATHLKSLAIQKRSRPISPTIRRRMKTGKPFAFR